MSGDFHTYSPDKNSFVFAGISIISGWGKGASIEAERNEDGWKLIVGALGDVTRVKILDHTGKVKIVLMPESPYNDLLQALASADEEFGLGVGTLQILDHSGTTEVHSVNAFIKKQPKIGRGEEALPVEWEFLCADIEIHAGGNVTPF